MYTYYITFRIANRTVGGKTYDDRRNLLMTNARTPNAGYWDETTSFIIAESDLSTNAYAAKVAKGLSDKDDLVVVFDTTDMSACFFGVLQELQVLQSFFPKLKKVP